MNCPLVDAVELEVLCQCRMATWDGNVVSKTARDSLYKRGFIERFNGWQVVTLEGLAILETLGKLDDRDKIDAYASRVKRG